MNAGDACRLLRHAWEPTGPPPGWSGLMRQTLHLACTRGCGVTRHDGFDLLGNLTTRHYRYPDGYHYRRDEVPTPASLRLAMVKGRRTRRLEAAR